MQHLGTSTLVGCRDIMWNVQWATHKNFTLFCMEAILKSSVKGVHICNGRTTLNPSAFGAIP